jgi:xylan 1,4-beta-xylosidase
MKRLGLVMIVGCLLGMQAGLLAQEPVKPIEISADAAAQGKPLVHYWSKVVGAGRANEGLRATWQDELAMSAKYDGFQYVRFHGLFHDDMFVYREDAQGKPIYNWQYIDDVFDRMLALKVRPFVELGFVPEELATAKATTFWWKANGSPPNDYNKWAALVQAFTEHCVARYGAAEVHQWYFEVWNEPNLKGFFAGSQAQYFELYKVTAHTLKAVDPQLRVGGPATSNFHLDQDALKAAQDSGKPFDPLALPWKPIWIEDFFSYCKENNLPVDFISTHPYPQDFALDEPGAPKKAGFRRSIGSTRDDLRVLRSMVDASPYPKAEIDLTEWSSSPSGLDHSHDALAAAAFITKTNLESAGLVDALSYWVFTDVFEEKRNTDSVFHGGFGLINYQEIVKPAFHAYRFLNKLGDQVIQQQDDAVVTRNGANGAIVALAYNYPLKVSLPVTSTLAAADKIDASGSIRDLSLTLTHLRPRASFELETLDRTHGDAVAAWEAMGKPEPPTREQIVALREAAWATRKETLHADGHGKLVLHRALDPWSVVLLREVR